MALISYCNDIHGKMFLHVVVRVIWIFLLCVVCTSFGRPDWVVTQEERGGERRKRGRHKSCAEPVLSPFSRDLVSRSGSDVWSLACPLWMRPKEPPQPRERGGWGGGGSFEIGRAHV